MRYLMDNENWTKCLDGPEYYNSIEEAVEAYYYQITECARDALARGIYHNMLVAKNALIDDLIASLKIVP